jgi:hypothetical protein
MRQYKINNTYIFFPGLPTARFFIHSYKPIVVPVSTQCQHWVLTTVGLSPTGSIPFFFSFFLWLLHIAQHEQCTLHLFLFTTGVTSREASKVDGSVASSYVRYTSCSLCSHARTVDGRTDTTQDVRSVRGVLVPHMEHPVQ